MWRRLGAIACLAGLLLYGCTTGDGGAAPADAQPADLTLSDPCAMRLHDLSGALLLYHASTGELPPTLEALRRVPNAIGPLETFECPVSSASYVYAPQGVSLLGRVPKVVLFDASPVHDGKRWAVEVLDSTPGSPLVTKVVAIPEETFRKSGLSQR